MTEATISTPRLRLVPFSEEHITESYVSWLNDDQLMQYSEQRHRTHSVQSCKSYLDSFAGSPNYFWAILLKDATLHIGNINAYVDTNNKVGSIGILIGNPAARKQGFGLEAWQHVIRFLFQQGIRKVTAGTLAPNKAMLSIMERSGMVLDGIQRRHYVIAGGEEVDVIHMSKFNHKTDEYDR